MDFSIPVGHLILPRNVTFSDSDSESSANNQTNELLDLLGDGFSSQLGADAFVYSLAIYLGLSVVIALLFCFLRPRNTVVYAPRAKYADSQHAPPPTNKSLLGWVPPLMRTKEQEMIEKVGMDAAIFMRFVRMMRDMFLALSVLGCGVLIPVYILASRPFTSGSQQITTGNTARDTSSATNTNLPASSKKNAWLQNLTPFFMLGTPATFWAVIVCAWLFNIVICAFLWWNYRKVVEMKRQYFDSAAYQRSLHARTLLLTDIPQELRTDDGIVQISEAISRTQDRPRGAIARNVKDLPDLIEEHEEAVRALEAVLAKYLKNPDKLPEKRPICKASGKDKTYTKGQKVDAIDYWTARIKELEIQVKVVRESLDKRNPLGYGFASYEQIAEAHQAAYLSRKQGPQGTTIQLAPIPNDLIWKNLKMTKKERNWQTTINTVWVILLTLVWVGPNVFISIFLTNLNNIGAFWPAFQKQLNGRVTSQFWAIVQGVLSPAITAAFYFVLPTIFRRLAARAGNVSKTSRDRHVMSMLYAFFVLNNLVVVSVFSVIFNWVRWVVKNTTGDNHESIIEIIQNSTFLTQLIFTLIGISPYWLTFQLRLNFGSAMDLAQIINLAWRSFSRRFLAPTPREMIELSAPQPFDYAGYYNYYLFYGTIALCYAFIQPLILPITVLYFAFDHWVKKYILLYIFITKYESGGKSWRSVVNRIIFMSIMGNLVVALMIAALTESPWNQDQPNWIMLGMMLPPALIMIAFKFYCKRVFDDKTQYYQTNTKDLEFAPGMERKDRKRDRVGVRFGHPALYKPLMTPMVSSKSQHLLKQLYSGRMSVDESRLAAGYGDVYMDAMDSNAPGKTSGPAPFEIVNENELDFEHHMNRPDFQAQGGGDGALFGRAADIIRPDTPGGMGEFKRANTFDSTYTDRSRSQSRHGRDKSDDSDATKVGGGGADGGVEYPRGYHKTPTALRDQSPAFSEFTRAPSRSHPLDHVESRQGLVGSAASMGHSRVPSRPYVDGSGYGSTSGYGQSPGYGSNAYTPSSATPGEETSYDYFRRGRQI